MKSCPSCQNSYPTDFVVCPQDGTTLVEAGAWTDGSVVIGKYKILNRIGEGGMGVVYKAVHMAFDELRAIKVMHPSLLSDESFVKRFRHEARITRRLQHPNAVRVDDIEEAEDGRPFIVMEYIEGRSLKSVIHDEGAQSASRVCLIAKQVASALDAAHQLGMIHRDIKPENIVLLGQTPHEQAKVLDFGIAKIKEGRLRDTGSMTLTGAGVVVGTPQYMSPEQAAGKRGDDLDGRSDLYSLGVVMYQMLSGELPFHADTTMEMLIAHMQRPPMALQLVHPDLVIPAPLSGLVMRLLEKNPNRRPANARIFIEELEQAQQATPPPHITRIAAPEQVYSPEAAARAVRESLESGIRSGPRHPRPPASEPPPMEPPRPPKAAPPAEPVAARPQPAPAARPVPVAPPVAPKQSSGWAIWTLLGVLIVGVVGGGAWYFLGRQSSAPPAQSQPAAPTASEPAQQPAQSPAEGGGAAGQPVAGTKPEGKAETPKELPTAPQQDVTTPRPQKPSRIASEKTSSRKPEVRREVPPPFEAPKPAAPVVDEKAVKAALATGDLFYTRGDYDNAIAEYQKGLRADPANTVLREKIQAARRAKAAEERLRQ